MIATEAMVASRLVEQAHTAGVCAARIGKVQTACPFDEDAEFYLRSAWLLGWQIGSNGPRLLRMAHPDPREPQQAA